MAPPRSEAQRALRQRNLRTALGLALIALALFVGFIAKYVWFGR